VKDQKVLLKAKWMLTLKKKVFKIGNLKAVRKCNVITNEEFKVKVKELLDL